MGRTDTTTDTTDLVVIRASAPKLAPKLVIVRETEHSIFKGRTTVTDKVKKVPLNVAQTDLDGILAFFEVTVVQKLSQDSGRLSDCDLKQGSPCKFNNHLLSAAPPAPKPPPKMPGGMNVGVADWQKLIDSLASDPAAVKQMNANELIGQLMGGALADMMAGPLALIPFLIDIFHTSHTHSDVIIGTLKGKGFTHISEEGFGPNIYKNLPYKSGTAKPVETVMDLIVKGHISDFGDPHVQSDIQTYAKVLVNGWEGGENQWTHQNIVYDAKDGGGTQVMKFITNANLTAGTADIIFWKTKAEIKLAPNFVIHRITDTSSNIFHSKATQRDVLQEQARDITTDDITALFHFFDIMALKTIGDSISLCQALSPGTCAYPPINSAIFL